MSRQLSAIVNGFRDRVAQVWPRLPGPLQTPQKSSGCLRASRAAPTLSIGMAPPALPPGSLPRPPRLGGPGDFYWVKPRTFLLKPLSPVGGSSSKRAFRPFVRVFSCAVRFGHLRERQGSRSAPGRISPRREPFFGHP